MWIGPHEAPRLSGEVVYDRKISPYLSSHADVEFFLPSRLGRAREFLNLVLGRPLGRAAYKTTQNIADAVQYAKWADVVVCSWENFDFLTSSVNRPVVLILHNVSSDGIRETLGNKQLAKWMAFRTTKHEICTYNQANIKGILTLSRRDQRLIQSMGVKVPVECAPPGAPEPPVPLAPNAVFEPELTLSGSYDWHVKRRDLGRFIDESRSFGIKISTDDPLPEDSQVGSIVTPARFNEPSFCSKRIRIGVIPDRFVMGHKLKVGFYVAHNAIVVCYADIRDEYAELPFADRFVQNVSNANDIMRIVAELKTMPSAQLRAEFSEFRSGFFGKFSWKNAGERLVETVLAAAGQS